MLIRDLTDIYTGNTIVLGTSEENVYVVRYNGSDVQRDIAADRLQKNRNVFVGLLQTGAKLIGLMSAGDRSRRLVKLLPIPLSPWLVSVGNCLSLWGNWASVGEEKVAWEFSLKNAIVDDVSMASGLLEKARMISAFEYPEGRKHVKILDATLMQGEVGAEKTVLLILSAHFLPKQSYVGDKNFGSRAQLWFHTLELSLPASTDRMDFDEAVSILHRVLVCENVLVPPTAQHGFFPRFYSLPPSWRVFVSWTEVGEDDFPTVYCAQFDVLNQPLLQLSKLKSADAAQLLCKSAVNSQVSTEKILAFSSLIEVDGACFILTGIFIANMHISALTSSFILIDGAVAAFAPKLTRREDQDSVNVSTVKDRYLLKPQRMIAQSTPTKLDKDTTTLLLSVALGKVNYLIKQCA